jgi:two-component system phosphate regulon sensor histidine kinase PhoR
MRVQAGRMNRILTDLLELSRLETESTLIGEQHVDVVGLLEASAELYSDGPTHPAIVLHPESRDQLLGSAAELESVVRNLLSNAVRHTPPDGAVHVTWRTSDLGAELIVADNGVGIAEEFIPRLTERFFRVDQGRSRDDGGVGLGLAIVKHILVRHDAELEIDSEPGKGSRFTCRFPDERVVSTAASRAGASVHSIHRP